MKLIIAVLRNQDADGIIDALVQADFRVTRFASTGGFLRRGNTTIMAGVEEDQVDRVIDLIRDEARARLGNEILPEGRAAATVFVVNLEEHHRL